MNTRNATNALEYGAIEERVFEQMLKQTEYERQTTFFSDLSIAEYTSGIPGITETYDRIVKEWISNAKYFTEFVMALNYKAWEHYENGNNILSGLYSDLYYKADKLALDTFKGEDLQYYIKTTD